MNERILEILQQSGGIAYDDDGNRLLDMLVGPEIEKFAKFIIEDCIQIIHQKTDDSIKVAFAIEQHFGVE